MDLLGSRWDLWWPPVWGGSYWTASLQYCVLRGGAHLGHTIGHDNDVAKYDAHMSMLLDYMQMFSNDEGFVTETTITDAVKGRSSYGSAPLTISIYDFDPSLSCDDNIPAMLTHALSSLKPPYYGFFGDSFIGSHPQFFASFNLAEQSYYVLTTWGIIGYIDITPISLKFWQ
ncbi:hypothetical protein BJV78DRAFT_1289773 [Lactifluus subvellereus]|nr:hypothetical protein BJV78DRAFT_1289773 [Lactifluus subvellereus]